MSTSYGCLTFIGIPVTRTDFIDTTSRPKCEHPEANGTKFCPTCGCPARERKQMVKTETLKPIWHPYFDMTWVQEVIEKDGSIPLELLLTETSHLGDLKFIHVWGYDNWYLGQTLMDIGGYENGVGSIDPSDIPSKVKTTKDALAKLGLGDREPLLYSHMTVS